MADEKQYAYKDPAGLTRWLVVANVLLIAVLVMTVLLLGAQFRLLADMQAGLFPDRGSMMSAAYASDFRLRIAGGSVSFLVFAAIILFLIWVYRTNANVHALGAQNLSATPGFAVGAYFIPFLNLFMPFTVMNETWKASIDASGWASQKSSPLIGIWWLFQIVIGIGGFVAFFAAKQHSGIDYLKNLTSFLITYQVADIIFRSVMVLLVRRISSAQRAQRLNVHEAEKIFS
jgi:hypothetical protein